MVYRKEKAGAFLLVGLMVVTPLSGVRAQTVKINGRTLSSNVPPITRNGNTLVAMRAIFEGLGATVDWDGATQTINAKGGATAVMMKIGNPNAVVNGQPTRLAQAPILFRGNTMVPLRFVSEALGAQVKYDADTNAIGIATNANAGNTNAGSAKANEADAEVVAVSIAPNKEVYVPGEPMKVAFTAPLGLRNSAWIGIVPADIPRGDEELNEANNLSFRYLSGKTQGTLEFAAPVKLGSYDLRANDAQGNEVGSVAFEVKATTPEVTPTLSVDKTTVRAGEKINVTFTAFPFYKNSAWVGLLPANIPRGDEEINKANNISLRYLSNKTQGTLEFTMPHKAGTYDFRMNDQNGNEIAATEVITVTE